MKKPSLVLFMLLIYTLSYAQPGKTTFQNNTNCDVSIELGVSETSVSAPGCDFESNPISLPATIGGFTSGYPNYCQFVGSGPGWGGYPGPPTIFVTCPPTAMSNFKWEYVKVTLVNCYSGYPTSYTPTGGVVLLSPTLTSTPRCLSITGVTTPYTWPCCGSPNVSYTETSFTPPTAPDITITVY